MEKWFEICSKITCCLSLSVSRGGHVGKKELVIGVLIFLGASFLYLIPSIQNIRRVTGHSGMAVIPSGIFWMGSDSEMMTDARPWHRVRIRAFWMDVNPVTNEKFEKFVNETHYQTVAEKSLEADEFPHLAPEDLAAGGPGTNLRGREKHPVVHISWSDAVAFCKWEGKRLPTEAEFEYAARGNLEKKRYSWGDVFRPHGKWMANTFQGHFPDQNSEEDGYAGTSPVGLYF